MRRIRFFARLPGNSEDYSVWLRVPRHMSDQALNELAAEQLWDAVEYGWEEETEEEETHGR